MRFPAFGENVPSVQVFYRYHVHLQLHFPHPPLLYHFFSMSAVCQQGVELRWSKQRIGIRQAGFTVHLKEYTCERAVNFDFSMDIASCVGVES